MNEKETALLIKQVDSLYPGRLKLEALTAQIWHRALSDQDYNKTVETLIKYSRDNRFPPTVADLLGPVIYEKPDSRDVDIKFQRWISDGGKEEDFNWKTGKGIHRL